MDFSLTPVQTELQERTRRFIADEVIPMENDPRQDAHGPSEALRNDLVARGRAPRRRTPPPTKEPGGRRRAPGDQAHGVEEAGA